MAKDLFSAQASAYAKYRPAYPKELFDYILQYVHGKERAWDCATGNGQAAQMLAGCFRVVEATDISEEQLKNAVGTSNIRYRLSPAEKTPFADNSFDLITVATAYHWLDWKAFYNEATRVGKKNGVVAVWAYNVVQCADEAINAAVQDFYYRIIHSYWDRERRHVEEAYRNVAFDFVPLPSKDFWLNVAWTLPELLGYASTWSAVQHYQRLNNRSPLPLLQQRLHGVWSGNGKKAFRFPLFLRLGRIAK